MRILKTKIRLAQEARQRKDLSTKDQSLPSPSPLHDSLSTQPASPCLTQKSEIASPVQKPPKKNKPKAKEIPKKTSKSPPLKNITVNYGTAMATFASSYHAIPYLKPLLIERGITMTDFNMFVTDAREAIRSIQTFRSLLIIDGKDNETTVACKEVFQRICVVFIKFFSVNWIMHSRLRHKMDYLKFRFKMMRRIQRPELFTCIKS